MKFSFGRNPGARTIFVCLAYFVVNQVVAEEWYPSRYGADDEIGAANNLTEDKVRSATALVQKGKVYSLAVDLNAQWPAIRGREFHLDVRMSMIHPLGPNQLTGHDDLLISHLALGTSVDGLGHVGINYRYYNGLKEEEVFSRTGLKKLGLQAGLGPGVWHPRARRLCRLFAVRHFFQQWERAPKPLCLRYP